MIGINPCLLITLSRFYAALLVPGADIAARVVLLEWCSR